MITTSGGIIVELETASDIVHQFICVCVHGENQELTILVGSGSFVDLTSLYDCLRVKTCY